MGVHSFLLFLWGLLPAVVSNDLLSRCISLRSPAKGLSSASAIRSIICKDGLPLPLDKFKINDVDTLIFLRVVLLWPFILTKYSNDTG